MKETKTQNESRLEFLKAAEKIKELGYSVFVAKDESLCYGYFSDGKKIGYFQLESYDSGITFATANKTPDSHGMHFLTELPPKPVALKDIDDKVLKKAFANYPDYFTKEDKDFMHCQKFVNLDEFKNSWQMEELKPI